MFHVYYYFFVGNRLSVLNLTKKLEYHSKQLLAGYSICNAPHKTHLVALLYLWYLSG